MIEFYYETDFRLKHPRKYTEWLDNVIRSEGKKTGEICYFFTTDKQLLELNIRYLDHNYLTDILSFDYSENDFLSGDIYISLDRVVENAHEYNVNINEELHRVMVHGILHFSGYNDDGPAESRLMRVKEEEKLRMFHVEQEDV